MTVLTLLAVLLVGQPDRLHDHPVIPDLSGTLTPAAASPDVERLPQAAPSGDTQRQAWKALDQLGRATEFPCMADIFLAESGWNPEGIGDRDIGGSVGLGQRHIPVWGDPRPWTVADQVGWFTSYADDRYGGWCPARDRWEARADGRVDGRMIGGWW